MGHEAKFKRKLNPNIDRHSSVCIALWYRLNSTGIETRCRPNFSDLPWGPTFLLYDACRISSETNYICRTSKRSSLYYKIHGLSAYAQTHINLPIFNAKAFAKHFYSNCNNACPLLSTISGIHSFSSLSYDRSKAFSKTSSSHSAIQRFLLQMRGSSPFLKVIQ
jgi:hypothetical protein